MYTLYKMYNVHLYIVHCTYHTCKFVKKILSILIKLIRRLSNDLHWVVFLFVFCICICVCIQNCICIWWQGQYPTLIGQLANDLHWVGGSLRDPAHQRPDLTRTLTLRCTVFALYPTLSCICVCILNCICVWWQGQWPGPSAATSDTYKWPYLSPVSFMGLRIWNLFFGACSVQRVL